MPSQVTNVASDDALTAIYRLEYEAQEPTIAARLAEMLEVSAPSMSAMLRRLSRDQLIEIHQRKHIKLAPLGYARAQMMIRRHRLAECLLVDVLGLEWWRAYEEAHLVEHALSPVTEGLVRTLLGDPARSPFGYPIPHGDRPSEISMLTLADLSQGDQVRIERVFEEGQELLQFFDEHNLHPGIAVEVLRRQPVSGTIELTVGDGRLVLGLTTAELVWVCLPGGRARGRVQAVPR